MNPQLSALKAELVAAKSRYAAEVTAEACRQAVELWPDVAFIDATVDLRGGRAQVTVESIHRHDGSRLSDRDDWLPGDGPDPVELIEALAAVDLYAFPDFSDWEAVMRLDVAGRTWAQIDA